MTDKYTRTSKDLSAALSEQRRFLRASCASYDEGFWEEAKRMATSIYVMLHDNGKNNQSILTQMGLKADLKLISSAIPMRPDQVPGLALSCVGLIDTGGDVFPLIWNPETFEEKKAKHKLLAISTWWEEPVYEERILRKVQPTYKVGRSLSRKNLLHHLRSKDNGAHFDPALEGAYVELAITRNIGLYNLIDGVTTPLRFPHLATMRQIAWEFEESIKHIPGGPELPPLRPWPPAPYHLDTTAARKDGAFTVIPPNWK